MSNELVTTSALKARQKSLMDNRTPGVFYALKALFLHLAANKNNPDLFFDVLPGSSNEGLVNGTCTLYALYLKHGNGATPGTGVAAYYKLSDHATVVQADSDIIVESDTVNEEFLLLYPQGHAFTTGIAAGSYTAYNGGNTTTASTAGDQLSGFAIVGA